MHWTGSIVFLGAADLEAVAAFYEELLQLKLYRDQGRCRIYRVPGGGMLGFCDHLAVVSSDKSPIITLLTQDVDQVHKRLTQAGFATSSPQVNPAFGIYHFFLQDPHGYTVEIQRFLTAD